jgi:hypothetical protein
MLFGSRKVRSAGRTSGSVEITLPARMQILEGVECRLTLRDGAHPEIVLQPDVSVADTIFGELWERLRVAFAQIGDTGEFSLADFNVGLLPPRYWHDRPPLSYQDALAIHRARVEGAPFQPGSGVNHLITFLSVGAAYRLGLEGRFALAFGIVVGYLASGISAGHGTDFERDAALGLFEGAPGQAAESVGALFNKERWEEAQAGFKRIYGRFLEWQRSPGEYDGARQRWWEALTLENGGGVSSVEDFIHAHAKRKNSPTGP